MGRFEIEIDDKGELVGDVPEPLAAVLKRVEAAAHGQGFGKGSQKAAEEAKAQIELNVKAELAKREALLPAEREKWSRIEEDNKTLNTRLAEIMRESDRTLKTREESHAREIIARTEAIQSRETLVRDLVQEQIEGLALAAGARDESLSELKVILNAFIGYDDAMRPFVKGEDGNPRLLHGKPIALKTFVKDYLDTHPHHRKPPAGRGGDARGGANLRGAHTDTVSLQAAENRIHTGDRSAGAINALFEASRARKAS